MFGKINRPQTRISRSLPNDPGWGLIRDLSSYPLLSAVFFERNVLHVHKMRFQIFHTESETNGMYSFVKYKVRRVVNR